jgi:methylenetetrahydrofolate reductase (NADPH)
VPIIPGLKILTTHKHLISLPKFFHLNFPDSLAEELDADPGNAKQIGIEWAKQQSLELLERGVPGIHYYIMGDPQPALDVIEYIQKK